MSPDPARTPAADRYFDAFYAAGIGAAVIGLVFLGIDILRGDPLLTPSLLGSLLFEGAELSGTSSVRIDMVALFSIVHVASFCALGLAVSTIVHAVPHLADRTPVVALLVFGIIQAGVLTLDALVPGSLTAALGIWNIILANALTATAIAAFLWRSHRSAIHDEGYVFSPTREPQARSEA